MFITGKNIEPVFNENPATKRQKKTTKAAKT